MHEYRCHLDQFFTTMAPDYAGFSEERFHGNV
jgi:hypothetical protein